MLTTFPIDRTGVRLRLREWGLAEVDGIHRWLGDPVVNRYLTWGTATPEASQVHLDGIVRAQRAVPRIEFFLAVELLAEPGRTIGDAGFTWVGDRVGEIGYFLEPPFWGHGYATEAARMVLELIRELGGTTATATAAEDNAASVAVMRRLGMYREPAAPEGRVRCSIAL